MSNNILGHTQNNEFNGKRNHQPSNFGVPYFQPNPHVLPTQVLFSGQGRQKKIMDNTG